MIMWRKGYPRVVYQPVVSIHGIYYVVKDEVIFKRKECEWVLPQAVAKHVKYNPRNLPVVLTEKPDDIFAMYYAIELMREFYRIASTPLPPSPFQGGIQ